MNERRTALTYDDVQLIPKYSKISSRENISLESRISQRYKLMIPFVASCMDTVCEVDMAFKMFQYGGAGCIHRFMTVEEQCRQVRQLSMQMAGDLAARTDLNESIWNCLSSEIPIVAAIGVGEDDRNRALKLADDGANVLIIDVAHGDHEKVIDILKDLKEVLPSHVDVIAGNIATGTAAHKLMDWGANGLRVGIGGGSLCTTRVKTGFGVPNLTSISDVFHVHEFDTVIMADGGIRNSGDIAKALAFGADCVMLGSLLAGTEESPGQILETNAGLFKRYRGAASLETKSAHGQKERNIEGVSTNIPYKGGVKYIIESLIDGLRSALSYAGAPNIEKFQPDYNIVTPAGRIEATPHRL